MPSRRRRARHVDRRRPIWRMSISTERACRPENWNSARRSSASGSMKSVCREARQPRECPSPDVPPPPDLRRRRLRRPSSAAIGGLEIAVGDGAEVAAERAGAVGAVGFANLSLGEQRQETALGVVWYRRRRQTRLQRLRRGIAADSDGARSPSRRETGRRCRCRAGRRSRRACAALRPAIASAIGASSSAVASPVPQRSRRSRGGRTPCGKTLQTASAKVASSSSPPAAHLLRLRRVVAYGGGRRAPAPGRSRKVPAVDVAAVMLGSRSLSSRSTGLAVRSPVREPKPQ